MIVISFPPHDFRMRTSDGKEQVFDEFRRQWVRLTPEEWVRQNILQYLVQVLQYPPTLIAVEKEIRLGDIKKRFDILVYHKAKPWMIIECKEMNVPLSETVLSQVLNYNRALETDFIIITNGNHTAGFAVCNGKAEALSALPAYPATAN
jgi:hypothetical protein